MEADVLCEGRASFSLDLHPAYINTILEGVNLQLGARLLRWDEELGGVLLAYRSLEKLPTEAAIRPYFVYIQLKVAAEVLLFRPRIGSAICGRVTKLGTDFIGMTVLGSINAAIGRQNIRADLRYKAHADVWESTSDTSHKIGVGGDVLFSIESLRVDGNGVLAILGSLKDQWTGAAQHAAKKCPAAFHDPIRWQTAAPVASGLDTSAAAAAVPGVPNAAYQQSNVPREGSALPPASRDAEEAAQPSPDAQIVPKAKKKRRKSKQELSSGTQIEGDHGQPSKIEGTNQKAQKLEMQQREAKAAVLPNGQIEEPGTDEGRHAAAASASPLDTPRKKKRRKGQDQAATPAPTDEEEVPEGEPGSPSSLKRKKKEARRDKRQKEGAASQVPDHDGSNTHAKDAARAREARKSPKEQQTSIKDKRKKQRKDKNE